MLTDWRASVRGLAALRDFEPAYRRFGVTTGGYRTAALASGYVQSTDINLAGAAALSAVRFGRCTAQGLAGWLEWNGEIVRFCP